MNPKFKITMLIAVFILGLALLSKITSNNGQTGSTCGVGSLCPTKPPPTQTSSAQSVAKPATVKPGKSGKVAAGIPKLVDLGSTTCIPCKMMASVLDDLSSGYKGKLAVEFININESREAAQRYKIRAIPTQVFIDASGKEFFRHEGYYPKEDILAKFKEHGIDLRKGK